jgi:hypothetical protein
MKRHERARRLGACLIFGCACVLYDSRGYADWETVPDVRLEAETNDNPSLNMVGPTQLVDASTRILADAALRIRMVEPRGELTFEPRIRTDAYAEEDAQGLESTDVFFRSSGVNRGQTVRIGYAADIASERILGVEFLETLPTEPIGDDPTAVVTSQVGVNEKRTRFGVSPYIEIAMNSRSTVLLDGRIVDVDYESGTLLGRTDFLERAIGGEYRRVLGDQRGTLGVRAFATGYEAAINANTTDTRGFELIYARDMSELWSWNVSAGTQRSDFAFTSGGRRIRGTEDTPIFGLGLNKRGERSSMRAEVARRMSPDALGFVAPRDEIRVAWQRAMSARVNGALGIRAIDAQGSPSVINSGRRYGRVALDVEWQLRPTWSFVAGYAYAKAFSSSVIGNDGSDSNAVTIGVRYRGRSVQQGSGTLGL